MIQLRQHNNPIRLTKKLEILVPSSGVEPSTTVPSGILHLIGVILSLFKMSLVDTILKCNAKRVYQANTHKTTTEIDQQQYKFNSPGRNGSAPRPSHVQSLSWQIGIDMPCNQAGFSQVRYPHHRIVLQWVGRRLLPINTILLLRNIILILGLIDRTLNIMQPPGTVSPP